MPDELRVNPVENPQKAAKRFTDQRGPVVFQMRKLGAAERVELLHPENLTPRFFDLSSGEAGEVLDKLRRLSGSLSSRRHGIAA